jgi:hypothetical protein
MRNRIILLGALMLVATMGFSPVVAARNAASAMSVSGTLQIAPPEGRAPLEVHIVSPDALVKVRHETPAKWVGCGFNVTWGDGDSTAADKCADRLKHAYATPGTYIVRAEIWHPGPDDAPVTDWADTTTIEVME